MWVKFTIRSLQTLAALIILFIGYGVSFWMDKPNPTVDYVAELNEMVRPKVDESQNAAPYYQKAGELTIKPSGEVVEAINKSGRGYTLTAEQKNMLLEWLEKNGPALTQLSSGTEERYYWYAPEIGTRQCKIAYNNYRGYLYLLGRGLCWRPSLMDQQDQEKILRDLRTIYVLIRDLKMNIAAPGDQVISGSIQSLADQMILYLMQDKQIKQESLPKLAQMFSSLYPNGYPSMDYQGLKLTGLERIQQVFTSGGIGGGHFCPAAFWKDDGDIIRRLTLRNFPRCFLIGISHPRREKTVQDMNNYYDMMKETMAEYPFDHYHGKAENFYHDNPKTKLKNNILLDSLLPDLNSMNCEQHLMQASFLATQAVVAIMQYHAKYDRYPESLEEISPEFLKELPRDPFGPGILSYKKAGDGFKLYSWGYNFEDDHGMPGTKAGEKTKNPIVGDIVFWPPEKGGRL